MKSASKHPAVTGKIGARMSANPANKPTTPGGRGGYDVDDEVFFTHQSDGPSSGRVVCNSVDSARCAERVHQLA